MDKNAGLEGYCKKCGKVLDGDELYCSQCQIELAEENIDDTEEEIIEPSSQSSEKRRLAVQLAILLIFMAVIIFRAPAFMEAFEKEQPIRQGTYRTDAQADQCISNLWRISRMLEDGNIPDSSIVCPVSGKPYEAIQNQGDTVVICPNPGLHDLRELRVSRVHPCPEVKR